MIWLVYFWVCLFSFKLIVIGWMFLSLFVNVWIMLKIGVCVRFILLFVLFMGVVLCVIMNICGFLVLLDWRFWVRCKWDKVLNVCVFIKFVWDLLELVSGRNEMMVLKLFERRCFFIVLIVVLFFKLKFVGFCVFMWLVIL